MERVFRIRNSQQNVETLSWNLMFSFPNSFHRTFATNSLMFYLHSGRDDFFDFDDYDDLVSSLSTLFYMLYLLSRYKFDI